MAGHSPGSVRACVFDAYGTLFDFASAARRCRDVLGDIPGFAPHKDVTPISGR